MAVLKIITYPDRRLRTPAAPVPEDVVSVRLPCLFADMEDTLEAQREGLALAANQVGIGHRLLVFRQDKGLDVEPWVANPAITSQSGPVTVEEGCLSFPGLYRQVSRYDSVTVKYEAVSADGTRTPTARTCSGLLAQAWQHEIAHLDGVLFVDDLPKPERERIALAMTRKKRG